MDAHRPLRSLRARADSLRPLIRHTIFLLILSCISGCGTSEPSARFSTGEARSADGVPIRYEVRGTGNPAIVLVHGWTNSRGIWGEHTSTLSRAHRVVALDLAGHGESGAERADWTIDAFGEDVVAVVEHLGLGQVVLVGFSMGGGVVLEAAERLGAQAAGVVFVDHFKNVEQRLSAAQADQVLAGIRASWGDTTFIRSFAFTPDAPDSLITYVARMMPEQPREHWFTIFRSYRDWMATELEPTLRRIEVPVAAINRPQPPTNVEAMRRLAASFTLDTMGGVGHAGMLLQRAEDFDAKLLAIVQRFISGEGAMGSREM